METANKTNWVIDPMHSEIHFKVKHLVIATVTGSFEKFEGSAVTTGDGWNDAQINFTADVNSINTNVPDRDNHLKSSDFFDATSFPQLTFKSSSFVNSGGDRFSLTGDLTIRGATRPVTLKVERTGEGKDPWGNHRAAFAAHTRLSRKDFGLTYNAALEAGGVLVGDEVEIEIEIEAIRAPA